MKLTLLLCLCAFVFTNGEEPHTTLDDFHDFERVVLNPEELRSHVDCYLDEGPCNELQESYKKNMPEAVPEACARCNDGQKTMFRKFLDGVKSTFPDKYQKYRQKYDPAGDKFDALLAELSKY